MTKGKASLLTTGFCFHHIKLKVKHERGISMKSLKELNEADRLFISRAVTMHCTAHRHWTHGEPVEIWRDEYEFLCVKYTDGSWWHYRQTETGGFEWW